MNASKDERAKERKQVLDSIKSISSHIDAAKTNFDKKLDYGVLDERIKTVSEKVAQEIAEDIRHVKKIDNLAPQAYWSLQHELHEERGSLTDGIHSLVNLIEKALDNAENQLSNDLLASGLGTRTPQTHLLPVSARTICKDAEARLIENLDLDSLSKVVHEATNWWQRIWDTKDGRKDAVERLTPVLEKNLTDALQYICEHTTDTLDKLGQEAFKSMEESCHDILERRRDLLDELEHEDLSDKKKEAQLNEELGKVGEQRLQVETLRAEYQTAVSM